MEESFTDVDSKISKKTVVLCVTIGDWFFAARTSHLIAIPHEYFVSSVIGYSILPTEKISVWPILSSTL